MRLSKSCSVGDHKACQGCSDCFCHQPNLSAPEPTPTKGQGTPIQVMVIADMPDRMRVGLERYGTYLYPGNGRDALVDLYQELLDAVNYTRQQIEERICGQLAILPQGHRVACAYKHGHPLGEHSWAFLEQPIPMVLFCLVCHFQHIDKPETDEEYGKRVAEMERPVKRWTNPPHKTHLCLACGVLWRPAEIFTTGVVSVTPGLSDTWLPDSLQK